MGTDRMSASLWYSWITCWVLELCCLQSREMLHIIKSYIIPLVVWQAVINLDLIKENCWALFSAVWCLEVCMNFARPPPPPPSLNQDQAASNLSDMSMGYITNIDKPVIRCRLDTFDSLSHFRQSSDSLGNLLAHSNSITISVTSSN